MTASPETQARNGAAATHATDADAAVVTVRRWLSQAQRHRPRAAAALMEHALATPGGLRYLTEVVDGVVRPEDPHVAAAQLRRAAEESREHLPWFMASLARAGAVAARVAPVLTAKIARRFIRALVGHLVVDARPARLGRSLRRLRRDGNTLNVNLLGEAVLGKKEAARRVERTVALISHPQVDYVSIKVSAAVAPHSPWAFDEAVEEISHTLRPLYEAAMQHDSTFVNLDMEEYHDLDLTLAVFEKVLSEESFRSLQAGIVIQAYLPESQAALERLTAFALHRVEAGGAPLRVRIVKGANLSMERVESEIHGWPLAPWRSKADSDAQYKRLLNTALDPERTHALKVGVAGHNLFDVALAYKRAHDRGVLGDVQFEMLLGMGEHVAREVSHDVGTIRLYTPVVDPRDFDVALAYLVRRLEEVANPQNFLSRLGRLHEDPEAFEHEERAFRDAYQRSLAAPPADTYRDQDNSRAVRGLPFHNTPDADPARPEVRERGRAALVAARDSRAGQDCLDACKVVTESELAEVIGRAHAAGREWGQRSPAERASMLESVADALERNRERLWEVMAAEAGKTLEQSDPEVSEAIDFARYYAQRARDLGRWEGAQPRPRTVTLVTPPWNFPVAIPAGSTLAALAAGSAVLLKPAGESRRCGAVLAEILWEAGVPRDAVTLLSMSSRDLGGALLSDERIDQVILTGAYETGEMFLGVRPELRLHAETSGKNAMIITPSADLDLAVADLVNSAFGHAGQKCSAASVAILVGSVAQSRRFHDQLRDAVTSLTVARSTDITAQIGPVIKEPTDKLLAGLTTLDDDETWWIAPERLGEALWTPGVRGWVQPGATTHLTEYFGPVLGVMRAETLEEAIALVNQIDYGLTSGLHSLDEAEIRMWLDSVEAGNLYVNRGTTGAIVQRQPFGGWKRAVVGPTVKAGGPHYVATLTDWVPVCGAAPAGETLPDAVAGIVRSAHSPWVRRAAELDAEAWRERFGVGHDPTGLASEYNILRYRPAPCMIWWDGTNEEHLARVAAAAVTAQGGVRVSTSAPVREELARALDAAGVLVTTEEPPSALARMADVLGARVRVIGEVPPEWVGRADLAVFAGAVTQAPDLELMPFLREQAVSLTAHRYGTPFAPAERVARDMIATSHAHIP